MGLHGYNTVGLAVEGKTIVLYGGESGGFHDDEPQKLPFSGVEDRKLHPDKYRFPADTFRPFLFGSDMVDR